MKIVHMADLHLGASNRKLSTSKQKILKEERLNELAKLFSKFKSDKIDALIISGDLFHGKEVALKTQRFFLNLVNECEFYVFYVAGNHDEDFKFSLSLTMPSNLILASDKLQRFDLGEISIYLQNNTNILCPVLEENKYNIFVSHGEVINQNDNDFLPLDTFKNKNVDYLALGHLHSFNSAKIDERGSYAYPGSLYSNGFDECGQKGYIELEIEHEQVNRKFVKFGSRFYQIQEVDITGLVTYREIVNKIKNSISKFSSRDIIRVILKGYYTEDSEKYIGQINQEFANYFYFELIDQSRLKIDLEKLLSEKLSFKAEFLRLVQTENGINEEEKELIGRIGIEALRGEELSI